MKLYCVYHIGAINGQRTQKIVDDQVRALHASGLLDRLEHVYYTVVGKEKDVITVPTNKFTRVYDDYNGDVCEIPAMNFIRRFSKTHRNDALLYIHTKGAGSNTSTWRKVMEHFCIHKFETCTKLLQTYHTVGCLMYRDHYAGNFWWTRCNYAADRKKLRTTWRSAVRKGLDCEFWIMNPPCRGMHVSLFDIRCGISLPPSLSFGKGIGLYDEGVFPHRAQWHMCPRVNLVTNHTNDEFIIPQLPVLTSLNHSTYPAWHAYYKRVYGASVEDDVDLNTFTWFYSFAPIRIIPKCVAPRSLRRLLVDTAFVFRDRRMPFDPRRNIRPECIIGRHGFFVTRNQPTVLHKRLIEVMRTNAGEGATELFERWFYHLRGTGWWLSSSVVRKTYAHTNHLVEIVSECNEGHEPKLFTGPDGKQRPTRYTYRNGILKLPHHKKGNAS